MRPSKPVRGLPASGCRSRTASRGNSFGVVGSIHRIGDLTGQEDIASVAAQLADLTRAVQEMSGQLQALRDGAQSQLERADTQQERIDLAARELAEVSDRLQAAARALRQSI
jgi:methyl-accepting chemotaxis protein